MKCGYIIEFPDKSMRCGAYYNSKRPDGLLWCHYPKCKRENCPFVNPDLLEDAKLELPVFGWDESKIMEEK